MEGPGLLDAVTPRGRRQWAIAVVALVFLAGAAGYAVRAFAEPDPNALSAVDAGFLLDMVDHHEQAVEMSIIAAERTDDPIVRSFAQEVIIQQRWEMGVMEAVLGRGGQTRGNDPERPAMAWMGMAPVPASAMPGLASAAEIEALRTVPAAEVGPLWLELMIDHHLAGAEMGRFVAAEGSNAYVRDFGAQTAENQLSEVAEYRAVLARLQAPPAAADR